MNQAAASASLNELAEGIAECYSDFTDEVRALGTKAKGSKRSGKFGESFAHWIGGSHVTTVREQLCDKFLAEVQSRLELLLTTLEGATAAEAAAACAIAAEVIMEPHPGKSNSTTDLMKRAMIGQAKPLLPYLSLEELKRLSARLAGAYSRRQLLPVEKEIAKELERLIRQAETQKE